MGRIMWSELFPTKSSFVIFLAYILLFVNQGILVTASQGPNNEYVYNTVTVVLCTEILKLILSTILFCKDHTFKSLIQETLQHLNVLGLYFVPAFLYCIYNNLAFSNLSSFDPTTYNLMLQLRVVVTGILFQIIFQKQLSRQQWFCLILLTIGCMLRAVNFDIFFKQTTDDGKKKVNGDIFEGFMGFGSLFFILLQIMCSCLAGVYNEHLLKKTGADVNIFVQNVFMYLDSIICNVLVLLVQGKLTESFTYDNLAAVFHYKVILIMINSAGVGIITSLFLKSLNSILKTFASALELVLIAVLAYIFLGIPVHTNTMLAIVVVSSAVYLYSKSPVVNIIPSHTKDEHEGLLNPVENV